MHCNALFNLNAITSKCDKPVKTQKSYNALFDLNVITSKQ